MLCWASFFCPFRVTLSYSSPFSTASRLTFRDCISDLSCSLIMGGMSPWEAPLLVGFQLVEGVPFNWLIVLIGWGCAFQLVDCVDWLRVPGPLRWSSPHSSLGRPASPSLFRLRSGNYPPSPCDFPVPSPHLCQPFFLKFSYFLYWAFYLFLAGISADTEDHHNKYLQSFNLSDTMP